MEREKGRSVKYRQGQFSNVVLEQLFHHIGSLLHPYIECGLKYRQVIVREAKRQNKVYREHAVRALGQVALARDNVDMSSTVLEIVESVVSELTKDDDDENKMDVDGDDKSKNSKLKEQTLSGAVRTVLEAIHPSLLQESTNAKLAKALSLIVIANKPNVGIVWLATFESIKSFFGRFSKIKSHNVTLNEGGIRTCLETLLFGTVADGYSEATRIERAQSILAVSSAGKQLILASKIDEVMGRERSAAVKQELEKAKRNLSAA